MSKSTKIAVLIIVGTMFICTGVIANELQQLRKAIIDNPRTVITNIDIDNSTTIKDSYNHNVIDIDK